MATAPWLSFGLADAVPAERVAACGIAPKLSGSQRDSMRAGRPRSQARPARRCRAVHSRENGRSLVKTNHQWTPIDTNRPEDRWTCFNDKGRHNASAILCPCACKGDVVELLERPQFSSRERGRPARTKPGTALTISPTWIKRERRHGSPSAWPMRFPPAGWLPAASHRAQRQPKGQHAGGTPALPGKAGPALPCGSFEGKRLIVNEDEPPMDTNRHK